MKEALIIEGLKKRDKKAMDAFNKQYKRLMLDAANKVTRNIMDAEDVVQDCFMKVLTGIEKFNTENSFKGWLWKISYLSAITVYNKEKRHRGEDIEGWEPGQVRANNFLDALTAREEYYAAMRMLQKAAPGQYMYVRLHFEEQMSFDEISKDLEVNINVAKSQASRGAAKLRAYLEKLERIEPLKKIA